MKVVVYWENSSEREVAERMAGVIGSLLKSVIQTIWRDLHKTAPTPRLHIGAESLTVGRPFTYPAESLAEQANRLMGEQEAAFAEPAAGRPTGEVRAWGGALVRTFDQDVAFGPGTGPSGLPYYGGGANGGAGQ